METGANVHLVERGTLSALKGYIPSALIFLCQFSLKFLQMGCGANGHLEKMDIWREGVPK